MNYGELKELVTFYVHRSDLEDKLDTFQELAIEQIATRSRLIVQERRAQLTFDVNPKPLPVDWASFKAVRYNAVPLSVYTKSQLDALVLGSTGGNPIGYTIDAGLEVLPLAVDAVIDFTYYARMTVMVDNSDQSPLLAKHPSLLLHSMTAAAHHSVQDTESQRVAQGEFDIALDAAHEFDKFAALSGGTPQMM